MSETSFFKRHEWQSFWIVLFISLGVYTFTLAPNVTLEDSGEFLTAAYHLGVPHPPGYPIWTVSAYLFDHLIPYGNAAWRVNFMSAFYGAIANGLLSLIACRLAAELFALPRFATFNIFGIPASSLCRLVGIVTGLIVAFIDTMWSQAVITEVYTLNAFFFNSLCLIILRWFYSPHQLRWPCLLSLFYGLGITNHQTLLVAAPAFLFAMYVANQTLCRDVSFLGAIGCAVLAWQSSLWFMWLMAAFLLGIYIYLLVIDPDPWSLRNLLSLLFSLMLGSITMIVFTGLAELLSKIRAHEPFMQWLSVQNEPLLIWIILASLLFIAWIALLIYSILHEKAVVSSTAPYHLSFLMFILGSSFYLYMPLSSSTNPPMNWGYTQTADGFRHHITREQYDRLHPMEMKDLPAHFIQFFEDLQDNFSIPLLMLGALGLVLVFEFKKREQDFLGYTLFCFMFLGFVLVYLLNAKFDEVSRDINRVFYSLAHGVYSLWIGLGVIFLLFLTQKIRNLRPIIIPTVVFLLLTLLGWSIDAIWTVIPLCLAAMGTALALIVFFHHQSWGKIPLLTMISALPLIPFCMNWSDSEMRGHDFGWKYGHDMLKDLDKNAVVYGGTDPGRFVPTYMIFVESFQPKKWRRDPNFDRKDLYIITQNALADSTYLHYIQDHYAFQRPTMDKWHHRLLKRDIAYPKEPIHLPQESDFNKIFQEVTEKLQKIPGSGVVLRPDADGKSAKASVQGIEAVFAINGEVARWVFEKNKDKHTFYVEESYPIQWMYPYLEPVGLIMKLNKEPLKELPPETTARDMEYWKNLKNELLANPAFLRDKFAQRAFSKLRSSIGGLYAFRKMTHEAKIALKQALELYPASAEACTRLTEIYLNEDQYEAAIKLCSEWQRLDPYSRLPRDALTRVIALQMLHEKEQEFISLYPYSKDDPQFVLQFAATLYDRNKVQESDKLVDDFLAANPRRTDWYQNAINYYGQLQRLDRIESVLLRLVKVDPKNPMAWYNLAGLQALSSKNQESLTNLKKSIELNTALKKTASNDGRFNSLRENETFKQLLQ